MVGVAGIGKSRLAWEFEQYLDGLAERVWWHRGRCLAHGDGVACWALAEMIRMRARVAEHDRADEALIAEFRGRPCAGSGDDAAAARLLADATAIYRRLLLPIEEARSNPALGEVLARTAPDAAAQALPSAHDLYERVGARPWVARVDRVTASVSA